MLRPHLVINDFNGDPVEDLGTVGELLHRRFVRALLASAAVACAIALAGCDTDSVSLPAKAVSPLSPDMIAEIEHKNMPKDSPILVRIFKEELELEVWKQDAEGHYAHLKTYPICRWSGELGPKVKQGDRQAPEGFYTITPAQMNPNSNYYLSFNLGFPNAYDNANNRNGAFLMVHGDCSSAGCYAMTDEQIGEIFALGRDSFFGGQKAFQVQAYPFRMTPINMARHRNSPHMAFWRMIKQGNDIFEVTRQEPKVDVCDKHYVFNAVSPSGGPVNFNPRAACPAYQMEKEIAAAVKEKQAQDERKIAEYVQRGTQTVTVRTGTDGGMHPTFLARLKPGNPWDGFSSQRKVVGAQPGDMGNNVNPPHEPATDDSESASVRVASAPASEPTTAKVRAPGIASRHQSRAPSTRRPSPAHTTRDEDCRSARAQTETQADDRRGAGRKAHPKAAQIASIANRNRSPRPRALSPTAATRRRVPRRFRPHQARLRAAGRAGSTPSTRVSAVAGLVPATTCLCGPVDVWRARPRCTRA